MKKPAKKKIAIEKPKASAPSKKALRDAAAAPPPFSLDDLDEAKTKKRLKEIYKFERDVESARTRLALATGARKSAKDALAAAEDALVKEIQDQRGGPGPLFAGVKSEGGEGGGGS